MNEAKGLTRKQLANASGAQPYIITYLFDTGRLPVIRQSSGPGDPTLYHPDSVDIVINHINRKRENDTPVMS